MNKIFILFLLFAAAFLYGAENQTCKLDFSGSLECGKSYFFRVRSIRSRNCEMKIQGVSQVPVRRDTQETVFAGRLQFVSREQTGQGIQRVFLCRIDSLQGHINGVKHDYPELSGRTLRISSLTGQSVRMELIPDSAASFDREDNVLSGENAASGKNVLTAEARQLLQPLFSGMPENLTNYTGKSGTFEIGVHKPFNVTPVIAALAKRKIPADANHMDCFMELTGMTQFYGFPVYRINLAAQGAGIPGYDFKWEVSLFIPADKNFPKCGPVRIARKAMEIVNTYMPGDSALIAGGKFEIVNNDMLDMILIPVECYSGQDGE